MLRRLKEKRGFTLVEIMIVVGIVILLGGLSIHSLLRAKVNANDGAAVASAKSIAAALESFRAVNPNYATNFDLLINASPSYLSTAFSDGSHQGYDFSIHFGSSFNEYGVYAQPEVYGVTGTKFIVYNGSGLQRFDDYERATAILPTGSGSCGTCGPPGPPPGY